MNFRLIFIPLRFYIYNSAQQTIYRCAHNMDCGKGILSWIIDKKNNFDKGYNDSLDQERRFLENGSMLLEELITFSNGRYNIPLRRFSVEELSQATDGFCSNRIVIEEGWYKIYKGSFEERLIFVKRYKNVGNMGDPSRVKSGSIRDLVMMAVMSSHKNVLKVLGCCLDFEIPALVCEYAGSSTSIIKLSSLLYERKGGTAGGTVVVENGSVILTWKTRLKKAIDVANVIVYMHTAFATPIIHRDLAPRNIIMDQCGVTKLLDFSFSMAIPPGERRVEVDVMSGTSRFIDPEYVKTGFLTEKSDVYGFGMFLLALLSGTRASKINLLFRDFDESTTHALPKDYDFANNVDLLNNILDPTILGEGSGIEQEHQFRAFAALALRCVRENSEDRPEMIDVAKELRRIMLKYSVCPSSSSLQP